MASPTTTESGALDAERSRHRPVPRIVDWVVGALLVLVGLSFALGGAALFVAIDRAAIRDAIAEGDVQSELLTDAELLDVAQATATWTAGGLIVIGALAVFVGVAYVVRRRRAHRRAAAGEPVSNYGANAVLGAIVAIVLSFVPFSQVLGGMVAGFLERSTSKSTVSVGAYSGFLSVLPVLVVLLVVLIGTIAGLLGVGEAALALGVATALLLAVAVLGAIGAGLGAIGGYVGGKLAGRERTSREPDATA